MPTPTLAPRTELQATLTRTSARLGGMQVTLDPTPGLAPERGVSVSRLADPADPCLEAILDVAGSLTGVADRRVLATWVEGWLAWWVLGPAVAAWAVEARVAPLDLEHATLWYDGTGPADIALGEGRWIVGPGDPLALGAHVADLPIEVVDTEAALIAALHARVVAWLEPLVEAFRVRCRVGVRQGWLQSADRMADALQHAARASGSEASCTARADELLARHGSPLAAGRGGFRMYPQGTAERVVLHRRTCCLASKAPGGELCLTCPVRPAADIAQGVERWLATSSTAAG